MKQDELLSPKNDGETIGQIISFVSAKGGVGKTILSATTAYLLLQSGMRVVTIDTDFSTRGLSLYLLGSVLESNELNVQSKHCLADSIFEGVDIYDVTPLKVNRGQTEYHVVISNKDVWRGGVPDERFLGLSQGDSGSTTDPSSYFSYLYKLCERFRKEYDYVILDTRGGYDFTSAVPATLSDGYVVVIEADRVSVEQVSGFKKKIEAFAHSPAAAFLEGKRQATLKGFIINKAIISVDEHIFPVALAREYGGKTFGIIPNDKDVIRAYQRKSIPQETYPDSDFSYYSFRAIEHIVSPSVNWSSGSRKEAFYKFFSRIRSEWRARKWIDLIQQTLVPLLLLLLAAIATIFYFFFKNGTASYALRVFLLCAGSFAVVAVLESMLGSLNFLRKVEVPKQVRLVASVVMGLLLVGFSYLAVLDMPKTFSQEPLLKRIADRDKMVAQQSESLTELQQQLANLQSENIFLTTDRGQLQQSLSAAQQQSNTLQTQSVTLQSQLASAKRDKDSLNTQLSGAMNIMVNLKTNLEDCQKKK